MGWFHALGIVSDRTMALDPKKLSFDLGGVKTCML